MIARVLRDSDSQPIRGGSFTTKEKLQIRTSWWATSMVQYLQSINKSITRQTIHFNNANQLISHQLFEHDENRQNQLHSLGITTYGELSMDCDNEDDRAMSLGLSWAAPHSVCNTPLIIRVGQVWEVQTDNTSSVYEIAGFENTMIHYYPWVQKSNDTNSIRNNSKLYLEEGTSVMMGAGSRHYDTMQNIFGNKRNTFLLTLGKEKYCEDGTNETVVLLKRVRQPCTNFMPSINTKIIPDTYQRWKDQLQPIAYHTAISTTMSGTICQELLNTCSRNNTASIVAQTKQGEFHALLIESTSVITSTELSLVAQAVASTLNNSASQPILTDSKKTLKLHTALKHKTTAQKINPLLKILNSNRLLLVDKVIEKRDNFEDIGMQKAKQSANGNTSQFTSNNNNGTITNIQLNTVLKSIGTMYQGIICDADGTMFIGSTSQISNTIKKMRYVEKRDEYQYAVQLKSNSDAQPVSYWKNLNTHIAAEIFKSVTNQMKRAMINRIFWDKHWHGRNKSKSTTINGIAVCELCQAPLEDQQHIIWHCKHPRMCAVRELSISFIQDRTSKMTNNDSILSSTLRIYNKIVMNKNNYSLLIGRIHQHQEHLFEELPKAEHLSDTRRSAIVKHLINHHRATYAPFVVAMYSERQFINNDNNLTKMKNAGLKTSWWKYKNQYRQAKTPERQLLEARESLYGVEQTDVLQADGSLVKKHSIDSNCSTDRAHKRANIDTSNSVMMRKQAQEEDARIKGKRKHTTIAEWLIPPVGSSDCMLLQDDKQVNFEAADTQETKKSKVQFENKKRKRQTTIEELMATSSRMRVTMEAPCAPLARTGEG